MSDTSTQDMTSDTPQLPSDNEKQPTEATPATKPKAKTAAKKAAKKATKKTAKKAARKTAKKTAKKDSDSVAGQNEPAVQEQMQFETTGTTADVPQATAQPSSEPSTETPAPSDAPDDRGNSNSGEKNKIGRVKGLGPIKRKDRNPRSKGKRSQNNDPSQQEDGAPDGNDGRQGRGRRNNNRNQTKRGKQKRERKPIVLTGDPVEVNGMLELAPKGFGFLRVPEKKFEQCKKDVFVPPDFIRTHGLRAGVWIHGTSQEGPRGPQLTSIKTINELTPEEAFKLPHFEELKAVNPNRRIAFETTPDRYTTRVLDIIAPVGRGQRGLIVSPPRSGKTTLLLHMAEAIQEKYDESIHLIILLIDERPEEVTEFRRMLPDAEIYASSNDDPARNHARLAEMCIERAKRLVEGGKDVLILMDSITRLARAYNNGSGNRGGKKGGKGRGYQSGGIVAGALEMPRRIFAAARNTRNAGSLTILATALVQTNARADEAIFQEFKGTGNMELMLDRRIAEQYIYPAVDIFKSGTRREELIMADHLLHKINLIRRGLAGHRPEEAMERLLFFLKKFPNNAQMLLEIKG